MIKKITIDFPTARILLEAAVLNDSTEHIYTMLEDEVNSYNGKGLIQLKLDEMHLHQYKITVDCLIGITNQSAKSIGMKLVILNEDGSLE